MKKNLLILFFFLIVVLILIYVNIFFKSRQEYVTRYNFVITNIKTDAKGDLIFYDSNNYKYSFSSYRFNKWDKLGISTDDKIFKESNSKNLIISRKINNKYMIYHIQTPNGMIPFSFYCK